MIFDGWYTDLVDIYRNENTTTKSGITKQAWTLKAEDVKCRIYNSKKSGPVMTDKQAKLMADDKMAVPLGTDIESGDKLVITRGGAVGGESVTTYYAGDVMPYYEPVGGMFNGLAHIEIGLLQEEII